MARHPLGRRASSPPFKRSNLELTYSESWVYGPGLEASKTAGKSPLLFIASVDYLFGTVTGMIPYCSTPRRRIGSCRGFKYSCLETSVKENISGFRVPQLRIQQQWRSKGAPWTYRQDLRKEWLGLPTTLVTYPAPPFHRKSTLSKPQAGHR
jgi:hypothetical protein